MTNWDECEIRHEKEGFACFVCLALNCPYNHFRDTMEYMKEDEEGRADADPRGGK